MGSGVADKAAGQMRVGEAVRNRLKVLRAERDWSQAELGGRLGVSRQAVNAIETGKYDPSLPLAFKLARLFDMKIEDIFNDELENGADHGAA
jgi:putative transcriptional regulator